MKKIIGGAALTLVSLLVAGCNTRSISNSGFDQAYGFRRQNPDYVGELKELDVLGVEANATIADADIAAALQHHSTPILGRSSHVLLIQSGADFPDAPMIELMRQRFPTAAFSGRPNAQDGDGPGYAKALRLAAARGGFDKIVCYWGVLESERKNKVTSAVSWVPVVGYVIPDEREAMRIQLKAVIVDVATGSWTFVTPVPAVSSSLSTVISRRAVDQDLVAKLKDAGYHNLVHALEEHAG